MMIYVEFCLFDFAFIFYCTLVSITKGNTVKSNKSELWNFLSFRGLPYLFEVRSFLCGIFRGLVWTSSQ